jgi:hypothetical protein
MILTEAGTRRYMIDALMKSTDLPRLESGSNEAKRIERSEQLEQIPEV